MKQERDDKMPRFMYSFMIHGKLQIILTRNSLYGTRQAQKSVFTLVPFLSLL